MSAADREADDAPSPAARRPRRRALPLTLTVVAVLAVVFVFILGRGRRDSEPGLVAPVRSPVASPSPAPAPAPAPPAVAPAPSTVRPTERAATRRPRAATAGAARAPHAVHVDRVSGDPRAREAVARALRQRLQEIGVDEGDGATFAVTLRADAADDGGGGATRVRCGLSLARQPDRQLAGSLSAHADVEGEGSTPAELAADAATACGAALADDLAAWLRRRP